MRWQPTTKESSCQSRLSWYCNLSHSFTHRFCDDIDGQRGLYGGGNKIQDRKLPCSTALEAKIGPWPWNHGRRLQCDTADPSLAHNFLPERIIALLQHSGVHSLAYSSSCIESSDLVAGLYRDPMGGLPPNLLASLLLEQP